MCIVCDWANRVLNGSMNALAPGERERVCVREREKETLLEDRHVDVVKIVEKLHKIFVGER